MYKSFLDIEPVLNQLMKILSELDNAFKADGNITQFDININERMEVYALVSLIDKDGDIIDQFYGSILEVASAADMYLYSLLNKKNTLVKEYFLDEEQFVLY